MVYEEKFSALFTDEEEMENESQEIEEDDEDKEDEQKINDEFDEE